MRLKTLTILSIILIFLTLPLAAQDDVTEILYSEALRNYILKDYRAAEKKFETLYRLDPTDIRSREMLVKTLLALGENMLNAWDFEQAEIVYLKAQGLAPANSEILAQLEIMRSV